MAQQPLPPSRIKPTGWIQTDRKVHEAWARMIARKPKAAMLAHYLAANVGEHNAVVASHKTLARMLDVHVTTIKRAIYDLVAENWLEVRQIGQTGTACAYVLNHRVAWSGKRDNIRYSLFSATVIAASDEQPDSHELGEQQPLRQLPRLFRENANCQQVKANRPPASRPFPVWNRTFPRCPNLPIGGRWTKRKASARSQEPCWAGLAMRKSSLPLYPFTGLRWLPL